MSSIPNESAKKPALAGHLAPQKPPQSPPPARVLATEFSQPLRDTMGLAGHMVPVRISQAPAPKPPDNRK